MFNSHIAVHRTESNRSDNRIIRAFNNAPKNSGFCVILPKTVCYEKLCFRNITMTLYSWEALIVLSAFVGKNIFIIFRAQMS